jgi:polyphosphate kinase
MCGNPFKIISNLVSPPKPKTPQIKIQQQTSPAPAKSNEELQKERDQLEQERQAFLDAQRQFNEDQRKFLKEAQNKQAQPVILPQIQKKQAAPASASETEESIASRRRGRRSLRIPLGATTAGAGGTGLNVPRG